MKIGICLVGVSGDGSVEHIPPVGFPWTSYKGRDWALQKEIVMSQIVNCWEGHDVNLYLTTYNHSDIENMVSFYNPKKVKVLDYHGSYLQQTYITALQQLIGEELDFIITIRPDIFLFKKLSTYPVQFDKFNFFHKQASLWEDDVEFAEYEIAFERWKVHTLPTYHLVNDALFMFPANMLETVIKATENMWNDKTHLQDNPVGPGGMIYGTMHNFWMHIRKFLSPNQINWLIPGWHRFENAHLDEALSKDFEDLSYIHKEYYLCRNADSNIEPYNKERDWKQFVSLMKYRLNIS